MINEQDIRVMVAKYIESQGWTVALVGKHGIKQRDPDSLNYEYFLEFTGIQSIKPKEDDTK